MNENEVILSILPDFQRGDLDGKLDEVFNIAAAAGVVLLPDGQWAEAKGGAYQLNDLLLPIDFTVWPTITAANAGMADVYPAWFTWNAGRKCFDFSQRDLCAAFIKAHRLTRHAGDFYENGEKLSDDDVRDQLLRSLSIVRKDGGGSLYGTFSALKAICKDDVPPAQKERLSLFALEDAMRIRGYEVHWNEITGATEIKGYTDSGRPLAKDDLITLMHDGLADNYKGVSFDVISQYITFLSREHSRNPVLELLAKAEWDGVDRLPQVYQLLGIEDDGLSKTLVRKWLYQTVALLFNSADKPFGADGCLVLNGGQGIGKTSFFRHLALNNSWFGEGQTIKDGDKDTARRAVTVWICELGELESTLKSDISALKAFVSDPVDKYRLPYGKSDIESPRHASLCATCNSDRYLIDPTGNRRWWTVPLSRVMPHSELVQLDALQLWAQIYDAISVLSYDETAACFRLTVDEQQALAIRNTGFEKPIKAQIEVQDILDQANAKKLQQREMSVTEFRTLWNDELRSYAANQISAALRACGIEIKHTKQGSRAVLPTPYQ